MVLTTAWMRTWICFGFIFDWAAGARPQFDSSTNMGLVLVPADAEVDSVIFRLRATDQDADFPLVFDITAAVQPIVRIENLPCTLYNKVCQANVILTRRLVPGRLHDFAVRVRDSKGDLNSMQATISVTNATTSRDMIFPHVPSIIMVPEDTKPGKELDYLLVRANPWHGKPVYIELWQPKELFTIRQRQTPTQTRGVITLIGELDFETQSMYTLTMYATDPWTEVGKDTRNIAGVHVVVIVQDVQDVPPVFTIAPPLTRINNSVKPGDVIMRVHAEDGDKGTPREVSYGLVSEGNPFTPFFNISEWTGEITLARPLDELTQITHVGAPILLTVVAEEVRRSQEEPPAQASVVELGLLLGEPGNSPPYFESDSYMAWMDENASPGTIVMFEKPYLTRVRDEDIGKTGVFALKLGNNNGTFEIMPTVAERSADFVVTVRDNVLMDYEMRKSLQFTIIAQEVGPATNLSTTVPVTVFLKDVNDNPPKFEKDAYEVTLVENVSPGTRVIQVHASDNDTGLSGSVRYTRIIGPGSETLTMNSESGSIVVASSSTGFDREVTGSLNLSVEAADENGRGLRSTVPLIVNLLDVNDNAPIFDKSIYEFVLNTDRTNFTSPAFIRAVDADAEPPNNEVRYELVHGNYENKFYLNEITGELILREPLSKSRRRRNNAYVNFSTKFRSNFLNTLDKFRKIRALTEEPLKIWKNRKKRASDDTLYALTVRAYDMGVPHRSSTAKLHIVTAAPMGALTLMLVVPAEHLDPARTTATLAAITGGRVTIQEIRPYDQPGPLKNGTVQSGKMSLVVARVEPTTSGTFLVDVEKIHKSLVANGMDIVPVVDSNTNPAAGGVGGDTAGGSVESPIISTNSGTLGAGAGSTVVGNGASAGANGTGNTIVGVNGGTGEATGNTGGSSTNGGTNGGNGVVGGVIDKEINGDAVENKEGSPGINVDDSKGGSNGGTVGGAGDSGAKGEGKVTSGGSTVVGIPVNTAGSNSGSSSGGTGGNISGGGTSNGTIVGQSPGSLGGSGVAIGSGETAGNTASDGGGDIVKGTSGTLGNIGGVNVGGAGDVNGENTDGNTGGNKDGETAGGTGGIVGGGIALGGNSGGVNANANINDINKTSLTTENEYIVYKAENKLLLWLLILLGLLMLLALLGLILCCICPGCPFYMAPRKRRVHSFESVNYQDGRPKRHLRRKQANVVKAEWSGKKQAWSADPTRRNWQFNRRNTKNRGIASLPGDVAVIRTPQEFQNAPSLRLRDGLASWNIQQPTQKHQELDRLYIEDVEAGRPYDIEDIDSMRRHEMERGSDIPRYSYQQADEPSRLSREQHYYRDGNAEVLRLVTRGHDEGDDPSPQADRPITLITEQQALNYRTDGKDILLRRFIEDQKMRQQHDVHGSIQEICVDSLEPRPHGGEQFMQKHEVILIPSNLERDQRQHREVRSPSIQRLIIDHGDLEGEEEPKAQKQQLGIDETELQQQRKMAAAMLVSTAVTKATEKPLTKIIGHSGSSLNVSSTYASRDIELARQNALLTQLLMDRDVKHIGVPGLDPGSYLETQSLPGQVAIATQTDRTASTQTDHYIQVRSRSDNDESEEEIRSRRKSKSKKRFGSEKRRSRSIWLRSPIEEESRSFSETRSSLLRRKAKEGREGRRATLEADVLREISDSLDEQVSSPSPEETRPKNTRDRMTKDVDYKSKESGDSNEDEKKQFSEIPTPSSPEMNKDKYHRRSHENIGISEAIRGQRLGSSARKQTSPSRSKTRSQKNETKSTESKKVVYVQSEKKESDATSTSTDTKANTKKRIIESHSSNGETDSKKKSGDKKKRQSKLLSKVGIVKSASEKSDKKNKDREKEEAPLTKKRTLLRQHKAKKVSTESSEFEELPNKSKQLSVKTKLTKQAGSASDSNSKQDPMKSKGSGPLSDEQKSRSSGTDHGRLPKRYQRQSDSTSSTGTTKLQDNVKDKTETMTIKEKKEEIDNGNKMAQDSHIRQGQLETQLAQQLIKLSPAIVMSEKFENDDAQIRSEVRDIPEITSDNITEKKEQPNSELHSEVLKSSTISIQSQLKSTAHDVPEISEKLDEISLKVISDPLKRSEISVTTGKSDSNGEKLLKGDSTVPEKSKEVDTDTLKSTTNILSIETQPESGIDTGAETVEKIADRLEEKSKTESPKENSEPLKLNEIVTAKETADRSVEKLLKGDSTVPEKLKEVDAATSQFTTNISSVKTQPEQGTEKVHETVKKMSDSLEEKSKAESPAEGSKSLKLSEIVIVKETADRSAEKSLKGDDTVPEKSKEFDADTSDSMTNISSIETQPEQGTGNVHETIKKPSDNLEEKSEIESPGKDSKPLQLSEIMTVEEIVGRNVEKLLKVDNTVPEKSKEADAETSESPKNILSIETQPERGTEKMNEIIKTIPDSLEKESKKESPKEDSEQLKLSEIITAIGKETVDQSVGKLLKKDSTVSEKSKDAASTKNISSVETQPESNTGKASEVTKSIPENLGEPKSALVLDVLEDADKRMLSREEESRLIAKERVEGGEKMSNQSVIKDPHVAESRIINILSEEKQLAQSVSEIPIKSENIYKKLEKEPDVDSHAARIETETLSEDMQPGPSAKEATQIFLQSESAHSSHDSKMAYEKTEDPGTPKEVKSVSPDRGDASQRETQTKDLQDSTDLVTDKIDGTETHPVESSLPTAIIDSSTVREIENSVKTPDKELEKIQDKNSTTSDTQISQPRVIPREEKRSDVIENKNDSPATELGSKSTNGIKEEQKGHEPAKSTSKQSTVEPLKSTQQLTMDRSPFPKHESIDQSNNEVRKAMSEEMEREVDENHSPEEPVKENVDKKSPKQTSSHDSQEEYFPRSGSPSFYILSSASSAEEYVPDQEISRTQVKSDQPLPEKTASLVSDTFTLLTTIEKPLLQSRKQSLQDAESGTITGEIRPRPSDLLEMHPSDWDSQRIRIDDISSDSPDKPQPYQTPRHRSKNRTTAVIASAREMTLESHPNQEVKAISSTDQSTLPVESLKLKEKAEGGFESSDERSSDSTSRLKIYQLTPKMIAEEAIRSGLKEIISDQSALQKKESSSQTSPQTSPESQRTEIPKRKPAKEVRRSRTSVEPKKPGKEKSIAGSQSVKKIEDTQEPAASSTRPKTEPKASNSHLRETQLARPRTQRGKAGDSRPLKPQEIPIREPRQDSMTRRSKPPEKTHQQERQNVDEVKPEDLNKSKPDEGPKEGHMSRYKKKREEMERKRRELREAAEEEQRPRWQRKPAATPPQRVPPKESPKKEMQVEGRVPESTTPKSRRKVRPLANAESEQLRAMVKEGRKQRKAEGGDSDDPTVEIFATEPPAKISTNYPPADQQATYQYEKLPPPFYLHPPPPPQSSPQVSPLHATPQDARRPDDDLDSGIAVSLQGGTKLRHQQLLEKKSVFDIAYSEAAPSQLRTDSTTPPS